MTHQEALELEMESDIGKSTIRQYLHALLTAVWEEDEGFSGKRPFGNSGWKWDVYDPLVKHGLIAGSMEDEWHRPTSRIEADEYVMALIDSMCGVESEVSTADEDMDLKLDLDEDDE
jgi:hypothetical protein